MLLLVVFYYYLNKGVVMDKSEMIKNQLKDLGLNSLEADIYLALLIKPDQTGYKIAASISKPVANTYKALNQLLNKGLVLCNEADGNKSFSAIEISEYMNKLQHDLEIKKESLIKNINEISAPQRNFGSYNLIDSGQVYEKAKNMITSSQKVLLIDSLPIPFEKLCNTIKKHEDETDTYIHIKLYHKTDIPFKNLVDSYKGDQHLEIWFGHWLFINKDGEESLIACFKKDTGELIHAVWSTDPFINFVFYNGMANEFMLIELLNNVFKDKITDKNNLYTDYDKFFKLFKFESEMGNSILEKLYKKDTK
jgi:sugar-specific transcriptional regulator TrmB